MRITPELLIKLAGDVVSQRTRSERGLVAVYVQGSVLREQPVLAGTADIDLFFIHSDLEEDRREIVHITDDIHYDIAHHSRRVYSRAKELRLHPWLGPGINDCKILYDPQHFLDFTQAIVRDQFYRPDYVIKRARPLAEAARQTWLDFQNGRFEAGPQATIIYLKAIEHAANAIASLSGSPLTERRFLADFPGRAAAISHPGLFAGLLGLIGTPRLEAATLQSWLEDWQEAYLAAAQLQVVMRLHSHRLNYYRKAIEDYLNTERYQLALWPLWRTWTDSVYHLPADAPQQAAWQRAGEHLGLLDGMLLERLEALDAYLDQIEETLETWAKAAGI